MIEIQQFTNKHIQIFEGFLSTIKGLKKINTNSSERPSQDVARCEQFYFKIIIFKKEENFFQGGALELDFLEQLTGVGLEGALVRGVWNEWGRKFSRSLMKGKKRTRNIWVPHFLLECFWSCLDRGQLFQRPRLPLLFQKLSFKLWNTKEYSC